MADQIRAIRGFNDILPQQAKLWQLIETQAMQILHNSGYGEIRLPIVEQTSLFARAIGASTDIVEKEMYTFEDRNGDSLTLRPEGTAGCVRAGITHGLFNGAQHRIWYRGPMFRHERPQKGRYRQFHQIGAEAYGFPGADIEVELIVLGARLWKQLGLSSCIGLRLNCLGTGEERVRYREALVGYLQDHVHELDEDSRRRLGSNPMRILDSKDPMTREILQQAPHLDAYLGEGSRRQFSELQTRLDLTGVQYSVDPFLVRGLDYYTGVVFEWTTSRLGAQDAVCSGGRYDGLIRQIGGRDTPAVGWALGMERLVLLMETESSMELEAPSGVYLVALGLEAERRAVVLGNWLRDQLPTLKLIINSGGGSVKTQLRRADREGAAYALILGESELSDNAIVFKPLRDQGAQSRVSQSDLPAKLGPVVMSG